MRTLNFLIFILFGLLNFNSFAFSGVKSNPRAQKILTATTNVYPGEHTEIWVKLNSLGELTAIVLEEYAVTEPLHETKIFPLDDVNSAEGVVLKSQLSVDLLILKGTGTGLAANGGTADIEFRKSNWFSETGKFSLVLKKNKKNIWNAYSADCPGKLLNDLQIEVWKGFGFGIDDIKAH